MKAKIIKNEIEYEGALGRISELMNADPGTPEGDELELLATLVELYEKAAYPIGLPDPVEAIKFRMEQDSLKQKDLVPFIGSKSKVSEVLARRRPLSITMIRNLSAGLGIPAEALLREQADTTPNPPEGVDWDRFPIVEMCKRGWITFNGTYIEVRKQAAAIIAAWAAPVGQHGLQPALRRQHIRAGSGADSYAFTAWQIQVSLVGMKQQLLEYRPGTITKDFIRSLVSLSYLDNGPRLAAEYLKKSGIHFTIEPHLPHTHLDGAAIGMPDGSPLVALTLRHDRLDNFWFTLCHELAHIALHFDGEESTVFFDDLDQNDADTYEHDADRWATEALIPPEAWRTARMGSNPSVSKVLDFAANFRISPAIPAGRIRKERKNYRILSELVGNKKVRKLFA